MKKQSSKLMSEMTTLDAIRYLLCHFKYDAKDLNNNKEFDSALSNAIRSLNVVKNFY